MRLGVGGDSWRTPGVAARREPDADFVGRDRPDLPTAPICSLIIRFLRLLPTSLNASDELISVSFGNSYAVSEPRQGRTFSVPDATHDARAQFSIRITELAHSRR